MLDPYKGDWHEQISEYPEYCEICRIDPQHPAIPPSEFHWLWILEVNEDQFKHITICDNCRNAIYQLYDEARR